MYWNNSQGYFVKERSLVGELIHEHRSVHVLYDVLVSMSLTRSFPVPLPGYPSRTYIAPPGSRMWSLRGIAKAANMALSTVQLGLARLTRLGLIDRASNKLGTVVRIIRFFQHSRRNRAADRNEPACKPGGVPMLNTYRDPSYADQRSLTDPIYVAKPAGTISRELPAAIKRMIAHITRGSRL